MIQFKTLFLVFDRKGTIPHSYVQMQGESPEELRTIFSTELENAAPYMDLIFEPPCEATRRT